MVEAKKTPTRTPEQLSTLERMFFGIGSVFGFVNAAHLAAGEYPLEVYFTSVIPLVPFAFIFAYAMTLKDLKNATRITALASGGYLVGEAAEVVTRYL